MNIIQSLKNIFLNEYLEKEFLETKDTKDLSTTRDASDIVDAFNVVENDAFYSMHSHKSLGEFIPMWRNLVARNIEVAEAVEEIVNEAVVIDDEDIILKIDFRDKDKVKENITKKIQDEWNYLYNIMDLRENISLYFQRFYIDAIIIAENIYSNKKKNSGIIAIDILDPVGMVQDVNKDGKIIYKKLNDTINYDLSKSSKVWKEEQISLATSGLFDDKFKIYLSYLNYAVRSVNQLNSIENSLIIYALTRSTEKLIYYVDVGDLNHSKSLAKVQQVARDNSSQLKYDTGSGKVSNVKDKIKLTKEIFLASRNGERTTTIENLSADQLSLGELPILEYFLDKVYRTLRVPRLRRKDDAVFSFGDSSEVERQEINFFKFIVKLRQRFNAFFRDILMKHLIHKGVLRQEEWESTYKSQIKFIYANNNNYAEMKRIAQLRSQIELLDSVKDYATKNENDEIILFSREDIQKNIMKRTDEEIEEIDKQIADDVKAKELEVDDTEEVEEDFEDLDDSLINDSLNDVYKVEGGDEELGVNLSLDAFAEVSGALKEGDEVFTIGKDGKATNKMEWNGKKLIKK